MTRDFTLDVYEELLQAGLDAGYEHVTVREYLTSETLPERFLIHRHDVDRKPENALAMARVEAEYGISSTYYFRTIEKTFRPQLIEGVEEFGHEVGYHYEDLDRADGDRTAAQRLFEENLGCLREHATVDTVCMHGNPLTSHDNRDIWDEESDFAAFGLLGEAYLSMDFEDVTYFSDTGRTWQDGALKIKDHTMGEGTKHCTADSTADLIALLRNRKVDRACLLSHPNRWADSVPEYVAESLKDKAINSVKYGLNVVR